MELPQAFSRFVHPKEEKKELFLSLLLGVDEIVGSVWQVSEKRLPIILGTSQKEVSTDSWEDRIQAANHVISSLQETSPGQIHNVIFGLPAVYLTETGDIQKAVRPHVKKLTQALSLSPMGFVSVHQAIVHHLKHEEGVPPTVILLGSTGSSLTVSVYKIGSLVGQKTVAYTTDIVIKLEEALREFTDLEVLPSRILLYGTNMVHLEEVKRELLRHPWQTRANFMHFPKIDVISQEHLIGTVSLVGASELAVALGPEPEEPASEPEEIAFEEPNVVLVDPKLLGFKRNTDILSETSVPQYAGEEIPTQVRDSVSSDAAPKFTRRITLPRLPSLPLSRVPLHIPHFPLSSRFLVVIGGIMVAGALFGGMYWFVPRAQVTILEIPQKLTKTVDLTIDPAATVADSTSKILPGKKQEKEISGEKTIAVTGKKQIGDPAKGVVKIYNKTFSALNLPKGAVLTAGNVQFTLDAPVSVASASAVTFTTSTGALTASAIGIKGNVSSGTIFTIKGYSLAEAAAQNDQAFSGGTSKDVTVVTRADQDALIKALTQELIDRAKQELAGSVGGEDQLIDETIKTTVSDKSFVEELDQEAGNLHGKATIIVSGLSYSKSDLNAFLASSIGSDIPSGYVFDPKYTTATLRDMKVKKDGKVTATARFEGVVTPELALDHMRSQLAGKTIQEAEEYLKTVSGVGGISIHFQLKILNDRLPVNANNISMSVAVQE